MCDCPGRLMSSVYCPLPVMKRKSSLRRTDAPIPAALMMTPPPYEVIAPPARLLGRLVRMRAAGHRLGARRNRLHDVVVARAPADISFELFPDGALVELVAEALHHVDRRHEHAGRAEALLQPVILAKCLLHGMQLVGGRQTLDGEDVRPLDLQRQDGAGLDGLAVDVNDTAAALRGVAADVRPGQAQLFAQQL